MQWQDFERSYYGKLSPPCLLQDLLSHTQISSVLICILQHCVPGKQCNSWPCSRNTKSLMSYGTLLPLDYFISFILNLLSTCTVAKHCIPWLQLFVVKTLVSSLSRSSGSQHSFSKGQSGVSNWPSPEIHNIYLGFVLPKIALPNLEKKYWLFFFSITATSRQEGWEGVQCTEVARFAPHWHVCNLGCNETVIQTLRLFVLQERHYFLNQSLLNGSFGIWRLIGSVQVPPQWAPLGYLDLYADHLICPDLQRK